jgi:hypothetical protein
MGYACKLELKAPFGLFTRGESASFSGRAAFRRAQKRPGAVTNLRAIGDADKGALDYKTTSADETSDFPIGPDYRIVFDNADNDKANWTPIIGGATLVQYSGAFGGLSKALGLQVAVYPIPGLDSEGFVYSNNDVVRDMAPVVLRFLINKAPNSKEYPVVTFRIPNGRNRGIQLEIARGRVSIMRCTDSWTQTSEENLHALLDVATIDAPTQATIDALDALLYADRRSIDLPGDLYGVVQIIALIPEPCGKINVLDGQARFLGQYRDSELLALRTDGKVWRDSRLYVRSNGPSVDFQVGRLQMAVTGQLRLGTTPVLIGMSSTYTFAMIKSQPAGTSITMSNGGSAYFNEIVVDFAVDDALGPMPLFYAGYAIRFPGTRQGYGSNVLLDTDDLALSPVEEGTPEFEPVHRRQVWTFQLRNVEGAFAEALQAALVGTGLQHPFATGAHLQCDVWLGTAFFGMTKIMSNGIIKAGGHAAMRSAEEIVLAPGWETATFWGESKVSLTVCDQWAILDEWLMETVLPVGDGMTLGAYIRDCLRVVGLDPAEFAGVSSAVGRTLPQARPGESWLVQPAKGTSLGDWLRHILDIYGLGRQLWINASGVWQFGYRSQLSVHTFNTGDKEEVFSAPLDAYQEPAPNFFRVEGGEGVDGRLLAATYQRWRAVVPQGGVGSRHFVGRVIAHPAVRDSSLVVQADVDYACRSLFKLYSKPGRGIKATTWLKFGIFPGDFLIGYAGQTYEIDAVQGGSIAFGSAVKTSFLTPEDLFKGRMMLVLREIEA